MTFAIATGITATCDRCAHPVQPDQRALTDGRTTRHVDCATLTLPTSEDRSTDYVGSMKRGKHGRQTRKTSQRKQYRRRKNRR